MITEDTLARHCASRTFQRARQIALHDRNILTKQVRYGELDTTLSAFVAASSGWDDRYRTSVTLDEDEDDVVDYSCTCPAFLKYDGMCKHAAALALSYLDNPQGFLGYKASRAPETSPSVAEFIRRAERLAHGQPGEPVRIEPTLVYGYESWSARFKLHGQNGSYVMKSASDFARALRCGSFVTYGKKLAFTHTLDAFDERSQRLASFIEHAVAQREHAGDLAYRRFAAPSVGRDVNLTDGEVIELVDILAAEPFNFECTDASMRSRMRIHVVQGDPHIPLRITRSERGGYVIERDEPVAFAAEGQRMYVLQDDMLFCCTPSFARAADFLRNVYQSGDDRLFIASSDMPLFCATALPLLEGALEVSAPPEVELYRPVEGHVEFYLDKTDENVEVSVRAIYGQRVFDLGEPRNDDAGEAAAAAPLRDEQLEQRALLATRELFYRDFRISLADEEALSRLLFGGLAQLKAIGEVFTTPAFDRLLTDRKPRLTMGLSIVGNLIDLDVSSDDVTPEELSAILGSYRRRKRFHRLRSGAFLNLEDYDLSQLSTLLDDLGLAPADLAGGHVELPTYRALYLDQELGDARRDESFKRYVSRMRHVDQQAYEVPSALSGVLRPYQVEGFRWMSALADLGFGGILADEMGLGKSVQLISFLAARLEEARATGPSLIVCPASVVYNWVAEFSAFAPHVRVGAVAGSKRERALMRAKGTYDVLVTSYDLLRADVDDYEQSTFFCHVLDEAQYIKNHATLTTRAVKRITSRHRFALTGTPMENRLSELWSIFDFLMPGLLGSYARFRERYELAVLGGDEDATRRLQALVGPFVLRRLKSDVLPDLPEKTESVVYVPLTPEQRRLYAASEQKLRQELNAQKKQSSARTKPPERERTKVEVLAELMRLRQIALDPALLYEDYRGGAAKLEAICDLVEQTRDADAKALVFSQFTSYLTLLADELDRRGIPYYTITGATPKKTRLTLVNAFNRDDTPVFLVSLKAGGTGLNLVGASVVIHADPWWNSAAQDQATDRAHRIGQQSMVNVYKIIAKGTIEERILALQDAKSELADSVIGTSSGMSLATLTQEQLLDLLEG